MNLMHDSESEQIRGGALINLNLPGINIPVITSVASGLALTTLSDGGMATNTSSNEALLASLLASFKL
jgi:hypothetical protein